jgi:hypothetical protein
MQSQILKGINMTNRELIRERSLKKCMAIFVCMLLGIIFCGDAVADAACEPSAI